ncbi:ribosomal silencing factor RsfS [Spirochaetia bacterium]|nr:ribosomal silencing factor RsfS [Spirochaetia bacterium]
MEDMLPGVSLTIDLAKLLEEHRGGNVTALDLRNLNTWTDFFIIATVTSSTHLQGLERHVKEFSRERDMAILNRSRKHKAAGAMTSDASPSGDEWSLLDMGSLVVHLMTAKSRDFYELERLWDAAAVIYPGTYSSKPSKSSSSS